MTLQVEQTRRQLLKSALAGAAGLALGAPFVRLAAQGAEAAWQAEPLGSNLYLLRTSGESNVVAQTGPNGVLLVDGGSAAGSETLLKAVAALPNGGAVHTLFNTHWHPEQTGSNLRLGQAGATIIAHENTRLWLATDVKWPWNDRRFARLPEVARPNKTFYTTGTLDSGVRYGYIPDIAHTDGDLYVLFPEQNVLVVGDVISNDGWPVVDYATGGWIGGMLGGVRRVGSMVDERTKVVPGRGAVLGLEELKAQLAMYETIYDRLTTLLNKGRSPDEAVEARPVKEFEAQMGNGDEFVRRAFESLWAYLSPDA